MDLKDKYICVFCASSPHSKQKYIDVAYTLGKIMGSKGIGCVCGAGKSGLMAAISDGTLDAGGKVIGVIPQFMIDNNWQYSRLSSTIITSDMHERKQIMTEKCSAVIALPGGVGTFEELLEVITWKQLGIFHKPIIILNAEGYYDNLLALFNHAINEDFMSASNLELWHVANSPQEAIEYLSQSPEYYQPSAPKY